MTALVLLDPVRRWPAPASLLAGLDAIRSGVVGWTLTIFVCAVILLWLLKSVGWRRLKDDIRSQSYSSDPWEEFDRGEVER